MAQISKTGGQYRQLLQKERGENRMPERTSLYFFRLRFYVSLCLFAAYLILTYTKSSIASIDSQRIQEAILCDSFTAWEQPGNWTEIFQTLTEEIYIK